MTEWEDGPLRARWREAHRRPLVSNLSPSMDRHGSHASSTKGDAPCTRRSDDARCRQSASTMAGMSRGHAGGGTSRPIDRTCLLRGGAGSTCRIRKPCASAPSEPRVSRRRSVRPSPRSGWASPDARGRASPPACACGHVTCDWDDCAERVASGPSQSVLPAPPTAAASGGSGCPGAPARRLMGPDWPTARLHWPSSTSLPLVQSVLRLCRRPCRAPRGRPPFRARLPAGQVRLFSESHM